ncbi:MAG: anti-sigma factor antagonist [Ignavibacteriales bacterium]|nr:MAG: anti-sigma factor antagonist [Ignavibacteriales bacterium]
MLQINYSRMHGFSSIGFKGRIDGITAFDVEKELEKHISNGDRTLLIDFSEVNYISSAGLRIFVGIQKNLTKIGGEIILHSIIPTVYEVFRISGLNKVFRIVSDKNNLPELLGFSDEEETGKLETDGVKIEFIKHHHPAGSLFTIGSQNKLLTAGYSSEDVIGVIPDNIEFGAGLAALGDNYEDYKNVFGESLVIHKNFYSYPAVKKSLVDFMLFSQTNSDLKYNFLYGFRFNGKYSAVVKLEKEDSALALTDIIQLTQEFSSTNLYGIILLAESAGFYGMHLKKIPITENKPVSGNIFDRQNFAEWIDLPLESANMNNIITAVGVVVKDKSLINRNTASIFSDEGNFHLHANVFEKGSLNKNIKEFDGELNRVLTELQILKVQHLLGKTMLKNVIAAVIGLEEA